jgi:hypothetical protein
MWRPLVSEYEHAFSLVRQRRELFTHKETEITHLLAN